MSALDDLERLHLEATPGPLRWLQHEDDHDRPPDAPGYLYSETARPGAGSVLFAPYPRRGDTFSRVYCQPADARILATSRNIIPEVIALAKAAEAAWVMVPMGQPEHGMLRDAVDALLRAIESEVRS